MDTASKVQPASSVVKIKYHTETVNDLIEMLVLKIKLHENFKNVKNIYAIPRGGYVPGVLLAHKLDLQIVNEPTKESLIVDDVIESGNTMQKYSGAMKVALVSKIKEISILYGIYVDKKYWVEFYWEKGRV
jgi:hypoxanthine phosphoribosyltransferase